jgi:hypothetical protein
MQRVTVPSNSSIAPASAITHGSVQAPVKTTFMRMPPRLFVA